MIDGILKALAGQGGAAFAKGVFDGYNEDVKMKQLQAYELAKEAAGKEDPPDTTRTLFKVNPIPVSIGTPPGPAGGTIISQTSGKVLRYHDKADKISGLSSQFAKIGIRVTAALISLKSELAAQ